MSNHIRTPFVAAAAAAAALLGAFLIGAPAMAAEARLENQTAKAGPGTLDSPVSFSDAFQLTAGADDASAQIAAAFDFGPGELSLGLKTPVKKNTDSYNLASLDGLSGATTVEVKFSYGKFVGIRPTASSEARSNFCRRLLETEVSQAALKTKVDLLNSETPPSDAEIAKQAAAAEAKVRADWIKSHDAGMEQSCTGKDIARLDGPERQAFIDEAANQNYDDGDGAIILAGLTGETGTKSFNYFDGATLASHDTNETVWSLGAFASYTPGSLPMALIASYKNQRTFEDADSAFLCGPPGGGGIVTCINGPIGAPKKADKQLLSLEGRVLIKRKIGVSVTATYDFEKDLFGVDAPIYLVNNGGEGLAKGLTGGVRLSWREDKGDVTAALFVSKPFSLF